MAKPVSSARRNAFGPWQNTLLVVFTLFVMMACAEAVTRALYHPENLGRVIHFDPALGWSLTPRSHLRSVDYQRDFDYIIDVNSLGMRDREVSERKSAGTKRILVAGDSFAFGTGVDATWRFSDIMQRALPDDVQVLNAAVCGWGNDQELLSYESLGRRLHPDIVVLTVMLANDVLNNMLDHLFLETAPKPRFDLVDGRLELVPLRVPPPIKPGRMSPVRNVLRKSQFLVFLKRRIDRKTHREAWGPGAAPGAGGVEREWVRGDNSHWRVYEKASDDGLEQGWQVTEAIIRRLAEDCRQDGADLVVFAFPLKIEVDDPWRHRLFERAHVDSTMFDLRKPYDRLEALCSSIGVEYVYPIDEFREAATKRHLFFESDGHPNEFGHVVAARVLLDRLQSFHDYRYTVAPADENRLSHLH